MRSKGNASELERRRRRAFRLMEEGESPSLIAKFLGCSRSSIYRWKEQAGSGQDGLHSRHPLGPSLTSLLVVFLKGLCLTMGRHGVFQNRQQGYAEVIEGTWFTKRCYSPILDRQTCRVFHASGNFAPKDRISTLYRITFW